MAFTEAHTLIEQALEAQMVAVEAALPQLEPAAQGTGGIDVMAQVSLAISMKRIADEICGTKERYGVTDSIREAIEQAIINATRR